MLPPQSSPNEASFITAPRRSRPEPFIRNLVLSSPYRHPPICRPTTSTTPSSPPVKPIVNVDSATHPPSVPAEFGVRKPDDPMTFSLQDPSTGKVRRPSKQEFLDIRTKFPTCTGYKIYAPIFILQCPEPPATTPLTVGGLPAIFVPHLRDYGLAGIPGNPKLPDLGGQDFFVPESRYPSFKLVEDALQLLQGNYPNIVRLQYKYVYWMVTICLSYFDSDNYPGKFGQRAVMYTWQGEAKQHTHPRLAPHDGISGDVTDYRPLGLSPGVKVTGQNIATSSGVLLQNGKLQRLSLAAHGFEDTDEVFHPDPSRQFLLGTIDFRFPRIDVALCAITDERIKYTNNHYFTANPPKKLVTSDFADANFTKGTWFEAEGFTSGLVHLFYSGPAVGYTTPRVGDADVLTGMERTRQYVLDYLGPDVGEVQEGLRGAPVVHEDTDDEELQGVVLGFISLTSERDIVVAAADDLVEDGWETATL